ncbi:UDP-forming cellulose synthase catalytic subunit [Pseudomonas sp. SDO528_S397]
MTAKTITTPHVPGRAERRLDAALERFHRWPAVLRNSLVFCAVVLGSLLFMSVVVAPLDLDSQCLFAGICFVAVLVLRKVPGRLAILTLVVLSLVASLRYIFWRLTATLGFETWVDMLFGYGLVMAEFYALVVLMFGYVQTAWPLRRQPVWMDADPSQWPTVDVFIPTYNESLNIVKLTIFAAQAMDWPKDKLRVHVLDDGRRDDFRDFCRKIGVNYIRRDNNHHAKAGNLNEALKITDGEFVTLFDADHVPTRSFLQVSLGWFIKDPMLAMLQTPHYFFSPDPFEKNLDTFRAVPNEGELFYGLVQDGNDLWNATFFCGSCAVIRRKPLLEIGGVAVETVTEDAHTALKLNRLGYNTAYLAIPQAAGLATESLSRHINQRIRWARGMAQIFRTDNPLLGRGLKLGQRICYANAMLHFFYGLPRLVFLTAPLAYLVFGAQIFHASALMILAYVLPHLVHSSLTNSRIQGRFRHSFWNEVYETVLAWYILPPVLVALVNPKAGGFNVTDKGGINDKQFFDWKLARPYLVLLAVNLVGMGFGVAQLVNGDESTTITVAINMMWTLYNLLITSAAVAVASEARQVRAEPRVSARLAVRVACADGRVLSGTTLDFSQSGFGLALDDGQTLAKGERLELVLTRNGQDARFQARVAFSKGSQIGAQFEALSLRQQSELVRLTFSRADTWAASWGAGRPDTPLSALAGVTRIGIGGLFTLGRATLYELRLALRRAPSQPLDPLMDKS